MTNIEDLIAIAEMCRQSEPVYFVVSGGDEPQQIFFDLKTAQSTHYQYIDTFDKDGFKVDAWKFEYDEWTQDF